VKAGAAEGTPLAEKQKNNAAMRMDFETAWLAACVNAVMTPPLVLVTAKTNRILMPIAAASQ
jgi:hypothetical protein